MAPVIVGMTISLDGFVNDRRGSVGALSPDLAVLPGGRTHLVFRVRK